MKRNSKTSPETTPLKDRIEIALICSAASALVVLAVFAVVLWLDGF
jgi:hypothetical protein